MKATLYTMYRISVSYLVIIRFNIKQCNLSCITMLHELFQQAIYIINMEQQCYLVEPKAASYNRCKMVEQVLQQT